MEAFISKFAPIQQRFRVNHQIRAPEVRLIDEDDQQIGVVTLQDALRRAINQGLDLVEVSPVAQPPVCRIVNFGKFTYQLEKQGRKSRAKQKKTDLKVIRLSLTIGAHDRQMREERTKEFLGEGHKVKIELILRGRENAHRERAKQMIRDFITALGEGVKVEQVIAHVGNRFTTIIGS